MTAQRSLSYIFGGAAALLVCNPFGSQVQAQSDSVAVAHAVHAYHNAEAAGDSLAMLALLTDDAVILESGGAQSKQEFRAHHVAADIAFIRSVKIERSAIRITVRGDAAWAWSTSTAQGESSGRAINSSGAELMVLVKTAGGWKISAIHWSSRQRRPS